ncbi:MAG: GDP-mannose 4,6-dehydratase [Mycobacteriales bacterium]
MTVALVTGGAGFIGSHLVDRLTAAGQQTVVVDDLSTGRRDNLSAAERTGRCRFVELDITNPRLPALLEEVRPGVVFHLAAQMDVRKSVTDPLHDTRINVLGTVNVLTGCVRAGVDKLVFASSGGTVYGDPAALPVREDAPLHPRSPYGAAKASGETYIAAFGRLYGLRWTSLALGNVYGPRQNPYGEAGVVAIFGWAMHAGRQTVIFGDGGSARDYVYVDDVVASFMACDDARTDGRRLNVGTGRETAIRELHRMMAAAAGVPDHPEYRPERLGELRRISLDASALTAATGWRPRVDLAAGLRMTLAWVAAAQPVG